MNSIDIAIRSAALALLTSLLTLQPARADTPPSAQFVALDQNRDGQLDYPEAVAGAAGEALILRHWLFFESDVDDDDRLTEGEYTTGSVSRPLSSQRDFLRRDVDRDGQLKAAEFLQWSTDPARSAAARNFQVVDFDSSGTVSLVEFQALPGPPRPDRGTVPDPFRGRADQLSAAWRPLFAQADKNSDGRLSADEWPADQWRDWGPLGQLPHKTWDLDQDQHVTLTEGDRVLELAFGFRRSDGEIVRLPTGQTVDLLAMRVLDKNANGKIERDEFLSHFWVPDRSAEFFEVIDSNHDGIATVAEIRENPVLMTDIVGYFLSWDTSLNGKIDATELAARAAPWQRTIPSRLIPAFDSDGDGELSFLEFRRTPVGNSVTDWYFPRHDANFNGVLSFEELYQEPAPFLIGIYGDVFASLDANRDLTLSLDEFEFTLDSLRAPVEPFFTLRDRDRNQQISAEELQTEVLPTDADAEARRQFDARTRALAELIKQFDANRDGTLNRDEFIAADAERHMAVVRDFAQRDRNSDGKLSREEYIHPNLGTKWEEYARAESVLFDLNDDSFLSLSEFKICPPSSPSPRHRFAGLDVNQNQQLELSEYIHMFVAADRPAARLHYFRRDVDGSGGLTLEEWTTEGRPVSWRTEFHGRDTDGDGQLSLAEFLVVYGDPHRAEGTRNFRFGDFDKNDTLSEAEFSLVPGTFVPLAERGPVPDPVVDLAADRAAAWNALFDATDSERKGRLIAAQWPTKSLAEWGPFGELPFAAWDRNQDHGVTRDEGLWLIDVAMGVRRPDGELIRLPNGRTVDWTTGRRMDTNHDGQISRDEFTSAYWMGPEKSVAVFGEIDADADGVATIEEIRNSTILTGDVVGQFLWFETSLNGEISEEEFLAKAATWQKSIGGRLIAAFDADGSGELSFGEFRLSPIANPASDWYYLRFDADFDGLLQFPEFYRETAPELIGLYGATFARLDRDRSKSLSLDELEFNADWTRVKPEIRFHAADRNHDNRITLDEIFSKPLPSDTLEASRHERNRAYHEEWLARGDTDRDGALSLEEFTRCIGDLSAVLYESFVSLDTDGDQRLTYAEYIQPAVGSASEVHAIAEAPLFDVNDDRFLSWKEFRISARGSPTLEQRFVGLDANDDGIVTEQEFLHPIPKERMREGLRGFCHVDTDGNGASDSAEWMRQGSGPRGVLSHFRWRDMDRDNTLTLEEYIEPAGDQWKGHATRDFRLIDRNGDRLLSVEEFQSAPGMTSLAERGLIADPVVDLMETRLKAILELVQKADSDGDGRVGVRQWPDLSSVSPDLAAISGRLWDRNRDGSISTEECRLVLELAYGVRLPHGDMVRFPNGRIVNVAMIRQFDADKNFVITASEFVPKFWQGPTKSRELFKMHDTNSDGRWDWSEMTINPETTADILGQFSWYDTDLDGLVDQRELDARMADWQKSVGSRLIQSFCSSGDGRMSFADFRLTPFANPVTDWYVLRNDADYDAKLSWSEYYNEESAPFLVMLYRENFTRFDRDGNGYLTFDELEFNVNLEKVTHDVSFKLQDKDHDGRLVLLEIFTENKPGGNDQDAQERYAMRLAAAETRFLADDLNRDGALNLEEYIKSREAALQAVERKTRALSRQRGNKPSNLPFVAFVILDVLVILGAAWFVWNKTGKSGR